VSQVDLFVRGAVRDDVPGLSRLSAMLGDPATEDQTRRRLDRALGVRAKTAHVYRKTLTSNPAPRR
jgi:hypothetical protein